MNDSSDTVIILGGGTYGSNQYHIKVEPIASNVHFYFHDIFADPRFKYPIRYSYRKGRPPVFKDWFGREHITERCKGDWAWYFERQRIVRKYDLTPTQYDITHGVVQ